MASLIITLSHQEDQRWCCIDEGMQKSTQCQVAAGCEGMLPHLQFVARNIICRETEFCAEPTRRLVVKLPHTTHNTQHNNAPDEPNIALRPRSITQLIFNRSPWNKYHREANHSGYISSVKCIFVGFDPCEPGASGDDMFCTSLAWSITMQKVRREMSECTQFSATIPSQGSFQIWMSPTNKLLL